MSEHWSVPTLGEDRFGLDPYETIDLLREKLERTEAELDGAITIEAHLHGLEVVDDAWAEQVRALREAIQGEIVWHEYEAQIHRNASYLAIAEVSEEAAERLRAILEAKK